MRARLLTFALACSALCACAPAADCPAGSSTVALDGGTACVVLDDAGSPCAPGQTLSVVDGGIACLAAPPSSPSEARTAGTIRYLPLSTAPDGMHTAIVDRVELFRHEWVTSSSGLGIDGSTLTFFDSNIGCPVNPEEPPPEPGRTDWWALNATTATFNGGHLSVLSGPTCVPGTSPAPHSVLFADAASGVRGCWFGHNPYLAIHCGRLTPEASDWLWTEDLTLSSPRASAAVGALPGGLAVADATGDPAMARTLRWLDLDGRVTGSTALLPGITDVDGQQQMITGRWIGAAADETWTTSTSGDGSVLIERRRAPAEVLPDLWVPSPTLDTMLVDAIGIRGAPASTSLVVSAGATSATLYLLSIDSSGRGTATALATGASLGASATAFGDEIVVAVTAGLDVSLLRVATTGEVRETLDLAGTLPAPQVSALAVDVVAARIFVATLSVVDSATNTIAAELIAIERR